MSSSQIGGVIGAVVGSFIPGVGTALGYAIGSGVGAILGPKPEGPDPGDLSAPKLQLGSPLPRVYGRVRLPVNPIAISSYRATEHPAEGGKGDEPPGSYTYSLDMLGAICDGTNVLAITRQWFNKKLIYTALADSSAASLSNSQTTDYYASVQLFTGGPSQMPAPLYEDRVGAANAPANRNICTAEWGDVQCGGGKQPPLMEVEIITAGSNASTGTVVGFNFNQDPPIDFESGHPVTSSGSPQSNVSGGGVFQNNEYYLATVADSYGPLSVDITADFSISADARTTSPVVFAGIFNNPSSIDVVQLAYVGASGPTERGFALIVNNSSIQYLVPGLGPIGGTIRGTWDAATNLATLYWDGVEVASGTLTQAQTLSAGWTVRAGLVGALTDPADVTLDNVRVQVGTAGVAWAPQTVTLASIISAELLLNPEVSASDFDVTDLEDIEVIGYAAVGAPAQTVADLCDIHYVDVVPGNPIRFQRRGAAAVAAIPYADTGAGVNEPGEPFAGLKRGNADEAPAVAALSFPLLERDHEAGYERGDRLATDVDDVRRIQTRVVMSAATAKGRAITATLLDRVRRHTAQFGVSDKYAELEPADAVTVTDNDGNAYRLRITRMSYADGVKDCEWELDDTTALVETGLTDNTYTPSIEIVPPGVAEWLPLDIPKQRPEDNDAGYYLAVKCSDDSRVYALESANDVTYSEVGVYPIDAVFGTVTAVSGTLTADGFFNEAASITVDVGDGTLSSTTRAALLADRNANAFFVGVNGRMVQGQFRTATLSGSGVYVLTGLLMGARGTERFIGDVVAGDSFCLRATNGGIQREPRSVGQLGIEFYIKAVPERRSAASITGEAFTNTGVSLKPLSPVQLRIARDASTGDIAGTFNRRTRDDTRFGGDYGDACPLGEESERYRVRIYTSGSYATVARDLGIVTSAAFTYTGAQQVTDFGSNQSTVYVGVVQISATVGEQGYELQDAA